MYAIENIILHEKGMNDEGALKASGVLPVVD